jgi:hypothetical protein
MLTYVLLMLAYYINLPKVILDGLDYNVCVMSLKMTISHASQL